MIRLKMSHFVLIAPFAWSVGCSSSSAPDATTTDAATDTAVDAPPTDAPPSDAAAGEIVHVRLANFAVGNTAQDVCIAFTAGVTPGPFFGPVGVKVGANAGVAYGEVSQFLDLAKPPHTGFVIRQVAAGAPDCKMKLPGSGDLNPPDNPSGHITVALYGGVHTPAPGASLGIGAGRGIPDGAGLVVNFANETYVAPTAPALELGAVSSGAFTTWAGGSGNSFHAELGALSGVTLAVREVGAAAPFLTAPGLNFALGSESTVFIIGSPTDASAPRKMIVCDDAVASGPMSTCQTFGP